MDACLLANTLNFAQDPHQILREAHRVLRMTAGFSSRYLIR